MSSNTSKSPAFQFYPSDFTGSGKVGVMTIDEVGAYTLLLCMEWDQGGFAYDEAELARFCRVSRTKFRKMWKRVSRCFSERDGRWFNPRLEAERAKQQAFRAKQQAKANARWAKPGDSRGNAVALPGQCSPISNLQSPISTTKTPKGADAPESGEAEPNTPPPAQRRSPRKEKGMAAPWLGELRPIWKAAYGGDLPKGVADLWRGPVEEVGVGEFARRLANYVRQTEAAFVNVGKFAATHGAFADGATGPGDPEAMAIYADAIAAECCGVDLHLGRARIQQAMNAGQVDPDRGRRLWLLLRDGKLPTTLIAQRKEREAVEAITHLLHTPQAVSA